MATSSTEPTRLNLTALIHARELSDREFHEALRDFRAKLLWKRPIVPTLGDVLRNRENTKGVK